MRGKAASLGECPPNYYGRPSYHLVPTNDQFPSSNCLRLARQLPCGSSHTSRYPPSSLGLLPDLRHHQRIVVAAHILLPRRNSRPKSRRNRSMVPQKPRLVRPQSQPLPRSTKRQAKRTETRHSLTPKRRRLRSDDGRLRARQR